MCDSYIDASYMIAFSYPILLIIICTVYAVLTRKIPEAFNESKHIGKRVRAYACNNPLVTSSWSTSREHLRVYLYTNQLNIFGTDKITSKTLAHLCKA